MMNKKMIGCCFAALVAIVGCSAATDGLQGPKGDPGMGGSDGTNGSSGANGEAGTGGVKGDQGEVGPQGDAGDTGDIACGDVLIKAAEWHSVCGSAVGACKQGQVQCRATLSDGNMGELILSKVCYGEVKPAANSGLCNLDADCDGQLDNTTGEGDNVSLVKQSYQVEGFISGSSQSFDATLVKGLCRNAKKHCLAGNEQACHTDENGEGVLWSDFGDLHTATADETKMGFECVNGQDVRTWECTVDEQTKLASVTCSGPRGL